MLVPDPNFFGDVPQITEHDLDWQELDIAAHPFGIPNRTCAANAGRRLSDRRAARHGGGAAPGRPHRANGDLALHVLEVLDAFERSSVEGRHVMIEPPASGRSRCRSALGRRGVPALAALGRGLAIVRLPAMDRHVGGERGNICPVRHGFCVLRLIGSGASCDQPRGKPVVAHCRPGRRSRGQGNGGPPRSHRGDDTARHEGGNDGACPPHRP